MADLFCFVDFAVITFGRFLWIFLAEIKKLKSKYAFALLYTTPALLHSWKSSWNNGKFIIETVKKAKRAPVYLFYHSIINQQRKTVVFSDDCLLSCGSGQKTKFLISIYFHI